MPKTFMIRIAKGATVTNVATGREVVLPEGCDIDEAACSGEGLFIYTLMPALGSMASLEERTFSVPEASVYSRREVQFAIIPGDEAKTAREERYATREAAKAEASRLGGFIVEDRDVQFWTATLEPACV